MTYEYVPIINYKSNWVQLIIMIIIIIQVISCDQLFAYGSNFF